MLAVVGSCRLGAEANPIKPDTSTAHSIEAMVLDMVIRPFVPHAVNPRSNVCRPAAIERPADY